MCQSVGWGESSDVRTFDGRGHTALASAASALPVRRRRAPLDGNDVDKMLVWVHVEKNAPVAEFSAEAGALIGERNDVAAPRINLHLVEGGPDLPTLFFGRAREVFECCFSDCDVPH